MKALSILQPWATLIAIGAKKIETRSWPTNYRGPIAIHASKGFPRQAKDICFKEPFLTALCEGDVFPKDWITEMESPKDMFPLGAIIAIGNLHKVGDIFLRKDGPTMVRGLELPMRSPELEFGNFTPGRFGWCITGVYLLNDPIPAKGRLGLWDWEGQL